MCGRWVRVMAGATTRGSGGSVRTIADALCRTALRVAYRAQLVYWFVFRPREVGAYVVLWSNGKVLLIRNSYRRCYCFPAGRVKRRECPVQAAARELREETGIVLAPVDLRFVSVIVSRSEYKKDESHFFEVELKDMPADLPPNHVPAPIRVGTG